MPSSQLIFGLIGRSLAHSFSSFTESPSLLLESILFAARRVALARFAVLRFAYAEFMASLVLPDRRTLYLGWNDSSFLTLVGGPEGHTPFLVDPRAAMAPPQ